ncbi:MAG: fibronectin [Calditrichaeota bacterium]|nr:MAG: fibronectin [Calditrichota bacterium]MBL1205408.1 fibronectin [Calditrichota bacterium]NOG45237.1 fibronectin [Calditrichota bacterium]
MYKNLIIITIVLLATSIHSQVSGSKEQHIRVGSLQSHFTAYGAERAWNNSYYQGMQWPADYLLQDNAVIERSWIAVQDFTDIDGRVWENYGIYFNKDYVGLSLFPIEHKQTAKFSIPDVYVDGDNINAPYKEDVDEFDPDQKPDRIVSNIVNTSLGLTVSRKILAFSQQYHDNYFIKIYTYTNTGNTDYDDDIELPAPIKGLRIGHSARYSTGREGSPNLGRGQSWGAFSWITTRGENYALHQNDVITEDNPIVDWIRAGFSWAGQSSSITHDNIGGPATNGGGRLTAPQHAGTAIIHVDKSSQDSTDDATQPASIGWHAGDTYPSLGDLNTGSLMNKLYSMLSGNPHESMGGVERMDERYMDTNSDPSTIGKNDGGGANVWINYGPFDLELNESITLVEVESVAGLSRTMCEKIGYRWKEAYDNPNDTGPFDLPDGSTTADKDVFKNSWFYTGKDSIMKNFGRAKRNFDLNYEIPQPPLPPSLFEITSGGDRISLKWNSSSSESESDFGGYRIYRAVTKPDTVFEEIFECGLGTDNPDIVYSFDDKTPQRGFSYYYYLVAFNDGSNNTSGEANPKGQLESGRFYTKTNKAAILQREPGRSISDARVVPNPYNIRAQNLQFGTDDGADRIMFLNIPAFCTIKIFTERGDLIKTIHHTNGSGDEAWNSVTSSRQTVVSGIYLAHIKVTRDYPDPETGVILYKKGEQVVRKFIIIR